jgi:phosphoglycolate phosphatase-like HAD superfamily hydrolase
MKIKELMEDTTKKMPHLYLDMDGVQADFFGAWAKRHGLKHYKEIPHPEDAINELAHSGPEEVYNFFNDLDPLNGGMQIIQWLHNNSIPFTVLSAPLRGPYSKNSIEAKKDWLDKHNPNTSNNAIFTAAKYKYAKKGDEQNVLVDDFGKYLDAWSNAGGIAVKHEDSNTQHTISELEKIYAPYINAK